MYRSTHDDLNNQNRQADRECEVGNLVDKPSQPEFHALS
jgi:hypothetical protein